MIEWLCHRSNASVGGIYTVIKTKTPVTVSEYGNRYTLIGPLNYHTAPLEVEIIDEPENKAVARSLESLRNAGIKYMYGKWLVDGAPLVLLLDVGSAYSRLNEWKGDLWHNCGIPSPSEDRETNEAILFGYLIAWFMGDLVHNLKIEADSGPTKVAPPAVIAHFHEWLAGVGLVLIKKRAINVATVFTTHATLLGRYLCAGDVDFYNNLKYFDVDAESGKRGIYHRYCIERAAAHSADVFTTVSHITAYESEYLLKRRPGTGLFIFSTLLISIDGVVPNGLSVKKFSALHEFQNLHAKAKEKIHDFIRGHFYGHGNFDLDNTIYFFTAGRYEYRNKGVDMFVESLASMIIYFCW